MATTVITTRIDDDTLARLDDLCLQMERSRAWLVAKAIKSFLEEEAGFSAFIKEGDDCFERGDFLTQAQMEAWVADRYRTAEAA